MFKFSFQNIFQQGQGHMLVPVHIIGEEGPNPQILQAQCSLFSYLTCTVYEIAQEVDQSGMRYHHLLPFFVPKYVYISTLDHPVSVLKFVRLWMREQQSSTKAIIKPSGFGVLDLLALRIFHLLFWMAPNTSCALSGDPPELVAPVWWAGGTYALHFVPVMPIPGVGGSAHSHSCPCHFLNGLLQCNLCLYRIE